MTTPMFDLENAATLLEQVVAGIADDQLTAPTPTAMTVGEMVQHVLGFTEGFRRGATKEGIGTSVPPSQAAPQTLPPDWRSRVPAQLKALVVAWRDPAAWAGDTEVGGATGPAPQMACFALDEVIVHGWDLAHATGQPFAPTEQDLVTLLEMLAEIPAEGVPGLFGPRVPVAPEASLLDRVIALTGRDPALACR
ncbi:TIGR03086 family metal-binding protein [Nocardia miyunensis]|uniref:TIGR03086 family metal-binding protein n=1 Tax=Nocardia miyunensis TaxID=282684 RepID=UPI0008369F40|nr:TIGR03086 family metal-binding protein [Nocardia miyunensis]